MFLHIFRPDWIIELFLSKVLLKSGSSEKLRFETDIVQKVTDTTLPVVKKSLSILPGQICDGSATLIGIASAMKDIPLLLKISVRLNNPASVALILLLQIINIWVVMEILNQ